MAEVNSKEQFSVTLCNILDVMGYRYRQIKNSQLMAAQMEILINQESDDDYSVFIAGSKKEGLSFLELNSDMDLMFIFKKVKCFMKSESALRSEMNGVSYILDFNDCPPGYAKLEVDGLSNDENETLQLYSAKTRRKYFSSELLRNVMSVLNKHGMNEKIVSDHKGPLPVKPSLSQLKYYTDIISKLNIEAEKRTAANYKDGNDDTDCLEYPESDNESCTEEQSEDVDKINDVRDNVSVKNDVVELIYDRKKQTDTPNARLVESLDKDGQTCLDHSSYRNSTIDMGKARKVDGSYQAIIDTITPTGPSQATEYKQPLGTFFSQDNVVAMPALCTDYMRDWCARKRSYDFPTTEQIRKISQMDAHVVPVGCKMAIDSDLQWRVCFTLGEVEMIWSLNGTQLKLYVLLKLLAKNVIKNECPSVITSYVMKNIVLWMAELKPRTHFREDNIENCLIEAVHFLKLCLKDEFLPNYMIHSRNLLQGKLSLEKYKILSELLHSLLQERGSMVMRCEKVRDHLNSPYISGFFKRTGDFTRCCSDVFQMFYQPAMQWKLTDMESAFSIIIQSIERSITKQSSLVKMQSMVVLKYIENWITELPDKSKERIHKRSALRAKCGELKKRISLSFALDLSSDPNYKWLIKYVASLQADVSSVTPDQIDNLVMSESFLNGLADALLKTADYLGAIDDKKIGGLLADPTQIAQTMSGARRLGQSQANKLKQYSDIDLD